MKLPLQRLIFRNPEKPVPQHFHHEGHEGHEEILINLILLKQKVGFNRRGRRGNLLIFKSFLPRLSDGFRLLTTSSFIYFVSFVCFVVNILSILSYFE